MDAIVCGVNPCSSFGKFVLQLMLYSLQHFHGVSPSGYRRLIGHYNYKNSCLVQKPNGLRYTRQELELFFIHWRINNPGILMEYQGIDDAITVQEYGSAFRLPTFQYKFSRHTAECAAGFRSSPQVRTCRLLLYCDLEPGLLGIRIEHLDRIERILVEVLANQSQFLKHIGCNGDDMAPNLAGLENVQ